MDLAIINPVRYLLEMTEWVTLNPELHTEFSTDNPLDLSRTKELG
jgi:hypothetical protein